MRDSWIRAWLATLAVLVGASTIARSRHDDLVEAESPVMDWLLDGTDTSRWSSFDFLGDPWLVYPGTALLAFLAVWFSSRVAVAVVCSMSFAVVVALITNDVVDRPRPDPGLQFDPDSFPSLHVVQAGVFWGLVTILVWWFGAPRLVVQIVAELAIVATLLTGISQVVSGLHWPSDLVGSAIVIVFALIIVAVVSEGEAPRLRETARNLVNLEPEEVMP